MQLLNLILFWLFFGLLCAFLAKRQGRNQLLWFAIGLFLGLLGVALIVSLPFIERYLNKRAQMRKAAPLSPRKISIERFEHWHYLDAAHTTQGPIDFGALAQAWKRNTINPQTYLWSEGMQEWKRLSDLPDLLRDLKHSTS